MHDNIDNPTDTPPTPTWPPTPHEETPEPENTSGADTAVPAELEKLRWHWGAFALAPFWSVAHRLGWWSVVYLSLLIAEILAAAFGGLLSALEVGSFDLFLRCVMGSSGHVLAWRRRHFAGGLAQYFAVQRVWSTAGIVIILCCVGVLVAAAGAIIVFIDSFLRALQGAGPTASPQPSGQ